MGLFSQGDAINSEKGMSEQEVVRKATEVLWKHLSPAKGARFWAAWQLGGGNYLTLREQLFAEETVATLFEKVRISQEEG